ncbi:MAG: hypothetical protein ACJ77K_00065 [Bacteroidia bacterium]
MNHLLRKYGAVLFLLIFLFPMAEKELHAFEHRGDFHCTATDKHFHKVEHSCDLCDLTITSSEAFIQHIFAFTLPSSDFYHTPFVSSGRSVKAFQDLPARAPPVA